MASEDRLVKLLMCLQQALLLFVYGIEKHLSVSFGWCFLFVEV